jgi:hypothetical protein
MIISQASHANASEAGRIDVDQTEAKTANKQQAFEDRAAGKLSVQRALQNADMFKCELL